jgi:hypothetical protein
MKTLLPLAALCSLLSVAAFGENYPGKLIDANCYSQQKKAAGCDASNASTAFALEVSGKVYALDATGNAKAVEGVEGVEGKGRRGQPESTDIENHQIVQSAPSPSPFLAGSRRFLKAPTPPVSLEMLFQPDHKFLFPERPSGIGTATQQVQRMLAF